MNNEASPTSPPRLGVSEIWSPADFFRQSDDLHALDRTVSDLMQKVASVESPRAGIFGNRPRISYRAEDDESPLDRAPHTRDTALDLCLAALDGSPQPYSHDMLFNACPPPLLDTVALTALTAVLDPNALWDEMAGHVLLVEQRIIRFLAQLAGWETTKAAGSFTSGGKATLAYGLLQGLRRTEPDYYRTGLRHPTRVLASSRVHFSLESVCSMHGLGADNSLRLRERDGRIDPDDLRSQMRSSLADGYAVAVIFVTGGAIIDCRPDDIREVAQIIDEVVAEYDLPYRPSIHADAVVTWPWLAIGQPTHAEPGSAEEQAAQLAAELSTIVNADSFGADFHKLGMTANVSSCFISRDPDNYYADKPQARPGTDYGTYRPYLSTFENTRTCTGIISAYYVLARLGLEGLRTHVAELTQNRMVLSDVIVDEFGDFASQVNRRSLGIDVVIRPYIGMDPDTVRQIESQPESVRIEWTQRLDLFYRWILGGAVPDTPVIGYVPSYDHGLPALLLVPGLPGLTPAIATDIMTRLSFAAGTFIRDGHLERVRREERFLESRPTPPR